MKKVNNKILIALGLTISTIMIVALLITDIVLSLNNSGKEPIAIILLAVFTALSLFIYGIVVVLLYKNRLEVINETISSINAIDSTQEEIFQTGIVIFNEEQNISYITQWMVDEDFDKFLGKNISRFNLDIETTKKQTFKSETRIWEAIVSRRNRIILFKDITERETLKGIILSQNNAVLSTHISYSKKVNFNEAIKSEITISINQSLQEWANKVKGIYISTTSTENTSLSIFRWSLGEKDLLKEGLLEKIKSNLGKNVNDVTISMGVSYGKEEVAQLQDKSLRALSLSKSRGGDQLILEDSSGQTRYIGSSSIQTASNVVLNVKKFYTKFISDIQSAKEIFITSHNMADLDALGSVLGVYDIVEKHNKEVKIVLETFDSTTETYFKQLPKSIKDRFITQKEAMDLKTNRSHAIITDVSKPMLTQASKLLETFELSNVSVIDHHRASEDISQFDEEKLLIETSTSSSSELIVEMMKIEFTQETKTHLNKYISTSLLAGINLDSKQLSKNTTNSTFEAVSFLISNEANTEEVQDIFRPSQNLIKIEKAALNNIKNINKGIIYTFIDEDLILKEEETSILADKFLDYEGIEASFVLAKVDGDKYKLSARSNDKINVQLICESLGGGGHFNVAAASWKTNIQYVTVQKRISDAINKGIK